MVQATPQMGTAFTEGYVEADGFSIRYLVAGQGKPLVMLHGVGGLVLSKAHLELAGKYRVFALELPGFGQSPPNNVSRSVTSFADTVAQATAKLGLGKYALIGTSFGSHVALWQALMFPDQVDVLVLVSPTAVLPEGYTVPYAAMSHTNELLFAHPDNSSGQPPPDPANLAKELALLERIKGGSQDAALEDRLGEVRAVTLVVFGTADRVVPPEMGRIYRERIPNCHYVLVYDAGHAIQFERPEALTNAITDFVDLGETFMVGRRDGRVNP